MPQSALHLPSTTEARLAAFDTEPARAFTMIEELGAVPDRGTPFSLTLCLCVMTSAHPDRQVVPDRRVDASA